jgi:eukaryotic-like serine/threonine-protein kinase
MAGRDLDVLELARLDDGALRAPFRHFVADLAAAAQRRPLPLEGVPPEALNAFVARALDARLFADLEWLSDESAASALYELWFALPGGPEREALRTLLGERLRDGDLACFVVLARNFVQSGDSTLDAPAVRARVSLALSLPLGAGTAVDSLALALISEPGHARTWVDEASRGSLPSRRLAARLIERAAREAGRRFAEGDDAGLRALQADVVRAAVKRLLADREFLVWRHVAVARGLLVAAAPELGEEIAAHLAADLTPTEWRRAACSLSASIAVRPETGLAILEQLLDGPLMRREPGIAACLIPGLLRVAEVDLGTAERLLPKLVRVGGIAAAEAFLDLADEGLAPEFALEARREVERCVAAHLEDPRVLADDGAFAFAAWLEGRARHAEQPLSQLLRGALSRFELEGARDAAVDAQAALNVVHDTLSALVRERLDSRDSRLRTVRALAELDRGLLQSSTVLDLAMLYEDGAVAVGLSRVFEQLVEWLVRHEHGADNDQSAHHPALRMQRVRTLLHAVDAEGVYGDARALERRPRRLRVTRVLLGRVRKESGSGLSRAIAACLARSFDALVREQVFELSDLLLCSALYVSDPAQIRTLAEASMLPEASVALHHLAALLDPSLHEIHASIQRRHALDELRALGAALPVAHSTRVSALRWALSRLSSSLRVVHNASSLGELLDGEGRGALLSLREAASALVQLVVGTRRRLNPQAQVKSPSLPGELDGLIAAVESQVQRHAGQGLAAHAEAVTLALSAELPAPLARVTGAVLEHLVQLPAEAAGTEPRERRDSTPSATVQKLPMWLPATRLLGGFYVFHTLGEGGGGSVFAARRAEERSDEHAEVFALKVPEYNGQVAQLLSETEFLRMFREEAGALLALPDDHPNLARFVTFDAGVRPKPILVMEHVEGPNLEKLLGRRHVDVHQASIILAGVASGLSAMHRAGIAHLDLKPSNVIVRGFWSGSTTPVLVDFGLSGRRLRLGCGTPCYSAPEVWGAIESNDPRPSDVYAFGCLAYEVLTGSPLFPDAMPSVLLAAHVAHDGGPENLDVLRADPALMDLAVLLSGCLRREPTARISIDELLARLGPVLERLRSRSWQLRSQRAPLSAAS